MLNLLQGRGKLANNNILLCNDSIVTRVLNGLKDEILETRKKIRIAEVRIEKKKAIVQKPFDCKEIHHLKGEIEVTINTLLATIMILLAITFF